MQLEIKKTTRLVDEVTHALMIKGSTEIDVKIRKDENSSIIYIVDYNTKYSDEDIYELDRVLNIQRQREIEEFYWELVAEDNDGDELFLVGSMIDSAEVQKIDNDLYIKMIRVNKHKKCSK